MANHPQAKLNQMADEAGYLPDSSMMEFGVDVFEECLKVVEALGDKGSPAAKALRQHFGV